jgi:hypothetical protein
LQRRCKDLSQRRKGAAAQRVLKIRKINRGAVAALRENKRIMSEDDQNAALKNELKQRFTHRWMVKNVPFFLFLALLAIIYIYNGHYGDKSIRNINKAQNQLKELQFEYKTLKSEVMFRSKESELAKALQPFGLKEMTTPPLVLDDSVDTKTKN